MIRLVTLSTSWGISTLISRYSRKMTTASVSRMLTSRKPPEWFFSFRLGNSFFHPTPMTFSSQDITGVSR